MASKNIDVTSLQEKAVVLRREILQAVHQAGCGHPGGSLSAVEIMIALYFYKMNHRPQDPSWDFLIGRTPPTADSTPCPERPVEVMV